MLGAFQVPQGPVRCVQVFFSGSSRTHGSGEDTDCVGEIWAGTDHAVHERSYYLSVSVFPRKRDWRGSGRGSEAVVHGERGGTGFGSCHAKTGKKFCNVSGLSEGDGLLGSLP